MLFVVKLISALFFVLPPHPAPVSYTDAPRQGFVQLGHMRTQIMPAPVFRGLVVSFYLSAGVCPALAVSTTPLVQVSLVHRNFSPSQILCTSLVENDKMGPKSRDLSTNVPPEATCDVQARHVQKEEVAEERGLTVLFS